MRLVQGDRRFSPWKGSVVDFVVGVFLTQNVADHLSSSAYMALAASFPLQSVNGNCKDNTTTQDYEQTISTSALGRRKMFDPLFNGRSSEIECQRLIMAAKDGYGIAFSNSPSGSASSNTKNGSNSLFMPFDSHMDGLSANEVIVLDSQDLGGAVGKISGLEGELLDKINSASEEEVLVQINDVTIQKKVMECLTDPGVEDGPLKFLQDDIIDACIYILKDRNRDDVRAHGKVFIENTITCQLLHKAACSIYPIRGREIKYHKEYGVEYLKHDMIFLPINQNRNHWYLAVISTREREIQVLDSLGEHLQECEELNYILKQIEQCLELASKEVESNCWPNYKVASWKVTHVEEIPKQTDKSSCGLFVIKYMEYWTGEKLSKEFTQADIDLFRLQLAPRLMTSPLNMAGKEKAADKDEEVC